MANHDELYFERLEKLLIRKIMNIEGIYNAKMNNDSADLICLGGIKNC